jgi:cell division protein FtsI (penicillin-binding protein 3)
VDIKNEILQRIYAVMFIIIALGVFIFGTAIRIQILEGEALREEAAKQNFKYRSVDADRGNILTEDGSLLATSLPYYTIHMDLVANGLSQDTFNRYIDTLAICLAERVNNEFTSGWYKSKLTQARKDSIHYFPIAQNITYQELEEIKKFPIFNKGRNKGGFIPERMSKRQRPFRMLAHRTIGYVRKDAQSIGLEGAFDEVLRGAQGKQWMQKLSNGHWIPLTDLNKIDPENGHDIVTTIDVNIQDIAGNALLKALKTHDAHHGCAIVMEVKTGAIRAIANIGVNEKGNYWENYNYAIGESTEPGSTFKLATIMALLEDGYINLDDKVSLEMGRTRFYEEVMQDATTHDMDSTTIRTAFEISSNVGIAKLVHQHYNLPKRGEKFIEQLKKMHLHEKTGVEIEGEGNPYIKEAYSNTWSGTTLPWMATGYEISLTPLQTLTFFNAVANDGKMMRPYLVTKLQDYGKTYEEYTPKILAEKIASLETIKKVQELLLGVVKRGTAAKINPLNYNIAGKTGTAQTNYKRLNKGSRIKYQSSFAGYFPAEKPEYSCIVVVNDPKKGSFYGSDVAAPVFREISDRCYASKIALHEPTNLGQKPNYLTQTLPNFNIGYKEDFSHVMSFLGFPMSDSTNTNWTVINAVNNSLKFQSRGEAPKHSIPNVVGMGLRDATYQLEKLGLSVQVKGVGKVKTQSIKPFSSTAGRKYILLTLG